MTPELVVGCPGAGKTGRLMEVVEEELARGVAPGRVGFVSFTRQAAGVAVARAKERFNLTDEDLPWFRTLHSLAFRSLGLSRGEVLEGQRLREFAEYSGARLTARGRRDPEGAFAGHTPDDRALHMENLARVRCISLENQYRVDHDNLAWSQVDRSRACLAAFKRGRGLLDYTDMLAEATDRGQLPSLDLLVVDEAQDNTELQWRLVRKLSKNCRRVVVGADVDQAIFVWAGADAGYLARSGWPTQVLDQSRRVPAAAMAAVSRIAEQVRDRVVRSWLPRPGTRGSVARASRFAPDLADGSDDVLVLARNNYVLDDQVEPELRRAGVFYEKNNRSSINSKIIAAIRGWERLRRGVVLAAEEFSSVLKFISVARAGQAPEGDVDAARAEIVVPGLLARPWYEALDRVPRGEVAYLRAALARGEKIGERAKVKISTIHGAKGAEARRVVLLKEMARRTYDEMLRAPDAEARVWYVGCTRASDELIVVESATGLRCPWL